MTVTLTAKHDVSKSDDNDNETCCSDKVSEPNFLFTITYKWKLLITHFFKVGTQHKKTNSNRGKSVSL